jgi:hypothetical protein
MEDRYWWEVVFTEALIETDENLKLARINEALDAIEQRRLRPIRHGSAEDTRIKLAKGALERLKAARKLARPGF